MRSLPEALTHMKAATGLVLLTAFHVPLCQPMVFAVDFGEYPGYDGSQSISRSVAIIETSTEGVQQLLWDLSGVDTSCTPGAGDAISNGCGLRVHAGATCDSASQAGGHFFNAPQDPWLDITCASDSDGRSVGRVTVETGFHVSGFAARAFVVHELVNGSRAACGLLAAAASVSSAGFSPYPGYAGGLAVSGSVSLAEASDSAQLLTWELRGLDVACESLHTADNVANGCGMHVHAGTSCDDASLVGPHLFVSAADPWLDVVYVADSSGASRGVALVAAGVSLSDIVGRAFVVHELASGGRVSCALLGEPGSVRAGSPGSTGLAVKTAAMVSAAFAIAL